MPKSPVVARKRVKRLLTFDFSSSSKMAFLGLGGGRLGSLSGGSSGSCLIIPADKEKTNKEDSVIYLAALIMGLMNFFFSLYSVVASRCGKAIFTCSCPYAYASYLVSSASDRRLRF